MYNLYNTIASYCALKGIKPGKMCDDMGISRSTMTELKMGRKKTLTSEKLKKIADYLGVTTDALLSENSTKKETPKSEGLDEALVQLLQRVPEEKVQRVKDFVAGLLDK